MDGQVLSYDAETDAGLIRGGDGRRYRFAREQWRSAEAPAVGLRVDFEAAGEVALDVYALPGAAAASEPAAPETAGAWLRRRPGFPLGALAIFACFLPFVSASTPLGIGFSLFDIVSYASMMRGFAAMAPGVGGGVTLAFWCVYLLYAVPAAAAWLLFRESARNASARLRLTVGLVCLLGPFLVFALTALILYLGLPRQEGRQVAGSAVELLTNPGIGWILLIASSAGLIAVGCGWRPFGIADGE